jgi:hypothetical protein
MPRFVLLEHQWNGVHWDLMLEDGDVLQTWALDANVVRGVDVPARSLSAHRRVYLEYEGEVSGGRGSVRRIDEGTYAIIEWTNASVRVVFFGAQLVGEAELRKVVEEGPSDVPAPWVFRLGNFD